VRFVGVVDDGPDPQRPPVFEVLLDPQVLVEDIHDDAAVITIDGGAEDAFGDAADLPIEDDLHVVGAADVEIAGEARLFDPGYNEPDGAILFSSNGPSNLGGYSNPQADTLISNLGSGGLQALYSYEDYLAGQLSGLWIPQAGTQISAVSTSSRGLAAGPAGQHLPRRLVLREVICETHDG
jgi:hypothetical protein